MNFFSIIRKGTGKSLNALKDSAIYEIATEKLEPKPYAQQAKPLYLLSKYFSVAYHFISYSVALTGIILYSMQLDSIIYQIILILLAFILLFVIETAKGNSSNNVFSSTARKEQPNNLFLAILVITTIFSFCTSVWSAKEAVYYASTDSKFVSMDSLKSSQIDSVNTLYSTQIASLESVILSNQNTLNSTKTNWKVNTATKAIQESQIKLSDILEEKQMALLAISSTIEGKKATTGEKGIFIASLAAVIFFIFEIFNLVSYWFLYQYYSSVLLEKDLVLNKLSKTITDTVQDVTDTITNTVSNLTHTTAVQTTGVPSQVIAVSQPSQIGFKMPSQVSHGTVVSSTVPIQKTAVSSNGNRICKHCGTPYIYKQAKQKFCSSECRINNWKMVNGRSFKMKKKGGKNA